MRFVACWLVALAMLVAGAAPAPALQAPQISPAPSVGMAAGMLIDNAGGVLWARNAEVSRPPASLTKILTALVVLERANLEDRVRISREARNVSGARMYLEEGSELSVRDLLWGLLLASGNDAAVALAQKVSPDGSVRDFARLMNEKAASLGARSSTFTNPHGLDEPGHLASAKDMALITQAAMRNPTFATMVAAPEHAITWSDGSSRNLVNHNKLLSRYPGAVGVKTGYTSGAGSSLASAVSREGRTLIAITMGSPNRRHYEESMALYTWGFANLSALLAAPTERLEGLRAPVEIAGRDLTVAASKGSTLGNNGLAIVQIAPGAEPKSVPKRLLPPALAIWVASGAALMLRRRRLSRWVVAASVDPRPGRRKALPPGEE